MRKLVTTFATAGVLSMAAMSVSTAAPVPGFEAGYAALVAACSLPAGTVADCETQINAYSSALISGGVAQGAANQSFVEVRREVFALNAADGGFQAAIDQLFERLLPDSGAIGDLAPVVDGGPVGGGTGVMKPAPAPSPASPS